MKFKYKLSERLLLGFFLGVFFLFLFCCRCFFNIEFGFQGSGIQQKVTTRLVHPGFTGGEQCSCCGGESYHAQSSATTLLCWLQRYVRSRRVRCDTCGFQQLE